MLKCIYRCQMRVKIDKTRFYNWQNSPITNKRSWYSCLSIDYNRLLNHIFIVCLFIAFSSYRNYLIIHFITRYCLLVSVKSLHMSSRTKKINLCKIINEAKGWVVLKLSGGFFFFGGGGWLGVVCLFVFWFFFFVHVHVQVK